MNRNSRGKTRLGYLPAAGVAAFGAGAHSAVAVAALVHHVEGSAGTRELIFVAGFEYRRSHHDWSYYADVAQAGVNMWSRPRAATQVAAIRRRHPSAFIVAFPQWGSNYSYVSLRQERLAAALVDAGADLVVGHGSHMPQDISQHRGKWIVFGLGNFVYNAPGRFDSHDVLPFGLICRLIFTVNAEPMRLTLRLYPIKSDNKNTNYQPKFVEKTDFNRIINFYMPYLERKVPLEQHIRAGRDRWGYYIAIELGNV